MKKFTLVISIFLISIGALAQNFGGGVYFGLTTSQIDGDGLSGFDLWGVQGGVFTDYRIGPNSKFQMDLSFIQKGSRQVPDTSNNFVQYKARANYLEIPILYKLWWGDLSFEVGPAFDILVGQHEESNYEEVEPYADFNEFHLSGIFGINYHFGRQWYVNFRTNISITPARNISGSLGTPSQIRFGGGGQRHVVLSTALVYTFGED